jgi:hydroxyacylglutathione hydrolase
LEQGDMDKTSLNVAKRAGIYPQDFSFPACPVSRSLRENDVIQVGDLELRVLETPGHSSGHLSFLLDELGTSCLFSGDVVFSCGKIYIQNVWDCSIQEYAKSIAKLNQLSINRLFPGHGACILSQGQEHIEMAQQYFDRLEVPPNL